MAGGRGSEAEHWRAEAERLAADDARLEARSAALRPRLAELESQVVTLSERMATLAKLVFGDSTEKKTPAQSAMHSDAEHREGGQRRRRGQRPGSTGHGRRDYSGLETEEEIHDVDEDDRVCSRWRAPYVAFGEEVSEQIDWQAA